MWNIGTRAWTGRRQQGVEGITCPRGMEELTLYDRAWTGRRQQGVEEITCTRGMEELTRLYANLDRPQVWRVEEVTHR